MTGNVLKFDLDGNSINSYDLTDVFNSNLLGGLTGDGNGGFYVCDCNDGALIARLFDGDFLYDGYYQIGDQAILTSTHKLYQCAADNTAESPDIAVELTSPTWVEVSATNKYRMFDYTINTKSTDTGEITLSPGQYCTNLGVFGLDNVSDVTVTVQEDDSSGTELYNETINLEMNQPVEDDIVNDTLYNSKCLFDDLPVYATPYITVSFTRVDTSADWEVGDIAIGNARTLGVTVYESSTSRTSYNEVTIDDFGNETVVERASAEYTSFELVVFPQYADYVERILKDSLDQARIWVGDKANDEKLFTFGYYERSPITYSSPLKFETSLKIRGLV